MKILSPRALTGAAFLFIAAALAFAGTTRRDFDIGIGTVSFDEPSDWPEAMILPGPNGAPIIQLANDGPPAIQLAIAPFNSVDPKEVEGTVRRVAEEIGKQAVDPNPALRPLSGAHGSGFIFTAVDKKYSDPNYQPTPTDFKNITQGSLVIGKISLAFTILTNDDGAAAVDAALRMIKGASYVAAPSSH